MSNNLEIENLTEFDMAHQLKNDADIVEYLNQVKKMETVANWPSLWDILPKPAE